ncbi:MAG: hypothetical protein HN509_00865 [Halobacteriovoraceae bacterium]|jgi:tRNA pseudouridine65 synthase|nr:hypothetical protein [Halobacteriovoraceae bacterium]
MALIKIQDIKIKVGILYQDKNYIAVNKPSGLFVHPYKKNSGGELHLLKIVRKQTGRYLYPIHRLDRPVSGVLLFGLNKNSVRDLQQHWNTDLVVKEYLALTRGKLEGDGVIDLPLLKKDMEGRTGPNRNFQESRTEYNLLAHLEDYSLIRVRIKSGRKHQIRRHFATIGHHLLGDTTYGKGPINQEYRERFGHRRIFLHAHKLVLPIGQDGSPTTISCPLPQALITAFYQLGLTSLQINEKINAEFIPPTNSIQSDE